MRLLSEVEFLQYEEPMDRSLESGWGAPGGPRVPSAPASHVPSSRVPRSSHTRGRGLTWTLAAACIARPLDPLPPRGPA